MPDRLESMAVFVKVAETGSFSAAAKSLNISSQMVARHVEALEAYLSVRLTHRSTRSQRLTEFGQHYLKRCNSILKQIAETEDLAAEHQAIPQGVIHLNAPVTFGNHALLPVITGYLNKYPEVKVELTVTDQMVDPFAAGVDAVIRIGDCGDSSTLAARPLTPYRLIACAAPDYLRRYGTPFLPADLKAHNCLGYSHWTGPMAREWHFTKGDARYSVPVAGRLRASDWKALHQACLMGFGITLGPEAAMAPDLVAGRLVRILPEFDGPSRPMHLLWPKERRLPQRLRHLFDHIIAAFPAK